MPRPRSAILALVLALPAPGCCTLARLFCGPDDSQWVQIDYRTPRAALATFMEAVRRDNCRVIYDSLAESFKEGRGLGLFEGCVFWEHLKEEQSGLHMLGYAEVTEGRSLPGWREYELNVSGYRFSVELEEQQLAAFFVGEDAQEISWFAPSVFDPRGPPERRIGIVQWPQEDGQSVVIQLPDPASKGPVVEPEDVLEISISREWKVHRFTQLPDPD